MVLFSLLLLLIHRSISRDVNMHISMVHEKFWAMGEASAAQLAPKGNMFAAEAQVSSGKFS